MHPFLPFCIFIAARVFIQHVKLHPNDHDTASSVRFLLAAMTAMQVMNPLAASFLVQLDVELEGTGLEAHPDEARYHPRFDKSAVSFSLFVVDQHAGSKREADSCRRNSTNKNSTDSQFT
jgi:hypothetical protein